LYLFFS